MKTYKVLADGRSAHHGGNGTWPEPGEWLEVKGDLEPCVRGLHLCRRADLVRWLGPTIWEAEYNGEVIEADDKIVVRKSRLVRQFDTWNETTARLFAADCAARAVRMRRREGVSIDGRVDDTIKTVRRYARGDATDVELSAAESAARLAARSAAESAARLAARSAAGSAARSAAGSAARSAAWSAAESAAESAERAWQTRRLFDYLEGRRG